MSHKDANFLKVMNSVPNFGKLNTAEKQIMCFKLNES